MESYVMDPVQFTPAADATVRTFTGKLVSLLAPSPDSLDIRDIAHALSRTCCCNGHAGRFYSVADHLARVSSSVPEPLRLPGLLYRAHVAYLGSTVALLSGMSAEVSGIEYALKRAIALRFGLPEKTPPIVEFVDRAFQASALRLLSGRGGLGVAVSGFAGADESLDEPLEPLSAAQAEEIYLYLFRRYTDRSPRAGR